MKIERREKRIRVLQKEKTCFENQLKVVGKKKLKREQQIMENRAVRFLVGKNLGVNNKRIKV